MRLFGIKLQSLQIKIHKIFFDSYSATIKLQRILFNTSFQNFILIRKSWFQRIRSGSKSILFPWNIIRMTIPMQIRLKLTSIFVASKSPKLHFHRRSRSVLHTFLFRYLCRGSLPSSLFAVAYCLTVTTTPVSRKGVEEKRERQGIVNRQLRSLPNQLVVHRHSFANPSSPRVRHTLPLSANEHSY